MCSYLGVRDVALLQNLLQNLVLVVRSELVVQCAIGGCVEDTLVTVPSMIVSIRVLMENSKTACGRSNNVKQYGSERVNVFNISHSKADMSSSFHVPPQNLLMPTHLKRPIGKLTCP